MPPFTVNPHRFDPYKSFKFQVKWDGKVVAGVSSISALRRTTDVVDYRDGASPNNVRRMPGLTKFGPLVLSRGRTHDTEFEKWANKVWNHGAKGGVESSLKDYRKDIVIDLMNEAGQVAMAFRLYRCWPSEYVALADLDANASGVAFESMTLQCEGWERDYDLQEPSEPSFTEPA